MMEKCNTLSPVEKRRNKGMEKVWTVFHSHFVSTRFFSPLSHFFFFFPFLLLFWIHHHDMIRWMFVPFVYVLYQQFPFSNNIILQGQARAQVMAHGIYSFVTSFVCMTPAGGRIWFFCCTTDACTQYIHVLYTVRYTPLYISIQPLHVCTVLFR